LDEAAKVYQENVIPVRKAAKGYGGGYLLMDRKTGKGLAITIWDSFEDKAACIHTDNYSKGIRKFQQYFASKQTGLGDYEVITQG
ncbi:hypothetical protein ACFLVP_04450, partial [Chloroflexota bacterium]